MGKIIVKFTGKKKKNDGCCNEQADCRVVIPGDKVTGVACDEV